MNTDSGQMVASYTNNEWVLFDMETAKPVTTLTSEKTSKMLLIVLDKSSASKSAEKLGCCLDFYTLKIFKLKSLSDKFKKKLGKI